MTEQQAEAAPHCWWHPDRPTRLRCARCERYACPDCLREASVGYQCVDCVTQARRYAKQQAAAHRSRGFGYRTVAGARVTSQALVTPVLIALNVAVYVATAVQAGDAMNNHASGLFAEGYLHPARIALLDEWWRLIASGFLHFGLVHLAVNMFALWLLGRDLERLLGRIRYLTVYGLALLGGSVAVFAFDAIDKQTAGASGAVYGVLGGVLVAVLRMRMNATPIILIIAVNIFLSIQIPQISLLGHLGGLVIGAAATAAMVYAPQQRRVLLQSTVSVGLLLAMIGLIVLRDTQLTEMICGPNAAMCVGL